MAPYAVAGEGAGQARTRFLRPRPGCGSGAPADVEIARRHAVTGVDISGAQIDLARQNVPAGTYIHGDAGSVKFPAASFDAVVSFYTLEHLPRHEHETLLGRIHR